MPDPSTLFLIIVFSAIGLAAFRRGKRQSNILCLMLGIALIGAALSAAVWHT